MLPEPQAAACHFRVRFRHRHRGPAQIPKAGGGDMPVSALATSADHFKSLSRASKSGSVLNGLNHSASRNLAVVDHQAP
jgi:hypothetical protein